MMQFDSREKSSAAKLTVSKETTLPERIANFGNFPFNGKFIQRKTACACGGGCPACQAKDLPISEPSDAAEIEADQIADQVMRMPVSNRLPLETDGEKKVFRKRTAENSLSDTGNDNEAMSSPGSAFDAATRSFFEPRFGYDFSRVKIHHDDEAAEFAERIDARAFTIGNHISFAKGEYRPYSIEGRRLLAHELAHVVQQNTQPARRKKLIQRDDKTPAKGTTAAALPNLKLQESKDACACLLVIHNNELKAKQTAQLIHDHCSYNLLLREPANTGRELSMKCIDAKRSKHPMDPNECFPPEIAEQCINDEESCKKFVADNASSKNAADIQKVLQISFFLSIKNCSNNFSLPVIALHNNDIEDTRKYLAKKDTVGVGSLKDINIDKTKTATDKDKIDTVQELKDEIDRLFGTKEFEVDKQKFTFRSLLTETAGKTNIFRWCASPALAKCHIGDPDNPDKIVWVTNPKDFAPLSKKAVNVVLQTDPKSAVGTDAETDLSTLFPTVQEKLGIKYEKIIKDANLVLDRNAKMLLDNIFLLIELRQNPDKFWSEELLVALLKISLALADSNAKQKQIEEAEKGKAAIPNIRYLNIETPHNLPGVKDKDVAVGNFEFIIGVLKEVGLHCCGKDAPKAEENIKKSLSGE